MKNLFKKISAILIAAIMVLAMASTAFAADAAATTATGSITVTGLTANDGTTLKVYKVVGFDENRSGQSWKRLRRILLIEQSMFRLMQHHIKLMDLKLVRT